MKPTAGVGCALRELPLHTTVAGLRGAPRILVVDTQPSLQMALGSSFQGMFWSTLVLLASKGNSDIRVQQPRGPVYVQTGADLTLECTVTGPFQAGPVKWFKGEGDGRKLIFTNYYRLNRVTRKEEDSKKDFTIFLHQVVPEDAGIYYCVKQKIILGEGEDLQSGRGTEVFVHNIRVQQPRGPVHVQTGADLTLECTVTGDFPAGSVKWYKGEGTSRELIFSKYRPLPRVTRKEEDSSTDFTVFLHDVVPEDAGIYYCVRQRRIVREEGEDLQSGRGTEVLVDHIRVEQSRGPLYVQSGAVLTLECTVTGGIRPGPVKWFKGEGAGRELIFAKNRPPSRVTRKEEDSSKDFTIFLHNVVPEDAGIYYCVKQRTIFGGEEDLQRGHGTEVFVHKVDYRILVAVATVCILLLLLISGAVYCCIKKRRGSPRSRHTSRPEFVSPENERTPRKAPKAKEIVYAEVELSKIPPTPKPRNLELRSEYAIIRTPQSVAG